MTFRPDKSAEAPVLGVPASLSGSRWDDDDLRRRRKIVTRLYPGLKKNPQLVMSLASQDIPDDDLAKSVTKTAGFAVIQSRAKEIKGLGEDQQRSLWDSYTKTDRRLLKQAGYKGPPEEEDQGLFDQVVDTVTDLPGIRIAKDIVKGDFESALLDTPGVGGIAAIAQGKSPLESVARLTGVGQAAESFADVGGNVTDLAGQGLGGGLRELGLGDVAGAARDASTFLEEEVAAPALQGLNDASRFSSQLYRLDYDLRDGQTPSPIENVTGGLISVDSGTPEFGEGAIPEGLRAVGGLLSGDDAHVNKFTDAWERTAVGERYFDQSAVDRASTLLDDDPDELDIARELAGGSTIEDIAARYGDQGSAEYQDAYLSTLGLTSTERFGKALRTLQLGKVSPGRELANNLGLSLDSVPGTLLSGATDAVFTWYTDPLLIAGKLRHAWKAADAIRDVEGMRYALGSEASKVEAAFGEGWDEMLRAGEISSRQLAGVGAGRIAAAEEMASAIGQATSGNRSALYQFFHQRYPRFVGALDGLLDYNKTLLDDKFVAEARRLGRPLTEDEMAGMRGIESGADVWQWYQTQEGIQNLVRGTWQPGAVAQFNLPKLTRKGIFSSAVRQDLSRVIDWTAQRDHIRTVGLQIDEATGLPQVERQLPALADDHTRLYRIQTGPYVGTPAGVSTAESPTWWTDNIERAREAGLGFGRFGHFYYRDVPTATLEAAGDVADDVTRAQGVAEYLLPSISGQEGKLLGQVGDFAEVGGRVMPAPLRALLAPPARFVKLMTSRVPERGVLPLHGPDAPSAFARLLDMEYTSSAARGAMFDAFMQADSPAVRRELARSVFDRLFFVNGFYNTEGGRESALRYLDHIDQKYAVGGLDEMASGSKLIPEGILPFGDHADQIAMPNFKEMLAQGQRLGTLSNLTGVVNHDFVDAVMGSYWKPAMLLRLGFAPRAAGEEILATVLRSPEVFTQGGWLRLAKANGEAVATYRDVSRLARGIEPYIPKEIALDPDVSWAKRYTHYLIGHVDNYMQGLRSDGFLDRAAGTLPDGINDWLRGVSVNRLDPAVYNSARILADHPALQLAITDSMAHISSTRANWSLNDATDSQTWFKIDLNPEGTKSMYARRVGSKFVTYTGTDIERLPMFVHQADRALSEPVMQHIAQARALHVTPGQADAIFGTMERNGLAAADGFDAVAQVREALENAPGYRSTLKKYLTARADSETAAAAEALEGKLISRGMDDPILDALTHSLPHLSDDTAWALVADRRAVKATLTRPRVELDEVQRELLGPALFSEPEAYLDRVYTQLPKPDPTKVRVYGRVGGADDETALVRQVERDFGAVFEPEHQPWKYASTSPNETRHSVLRDVDSAKLGQASHTDNLFYVDLDPTELIPSGTDGVYILTQGHMSRVQHFADDIGVQLDDIRNWSINADSDRSRLWDNLIDQAAKGDRHAAEELGREVALRSLQHPLNARMQREMARGLKDRYGNLVQKPVAEGLVPVYFPTFNRAEADTAMLAVNRDSSTGRRFLALREDLGPAETEAVGQGPLFAASRWATADAEEARALADEIERVSAEMGQRVTVGLARRDVPEERIRRYFVENEGAGSHDFEIDLGDSLQSTNIDLDGRIITGPGGELANGISYEDALRDHADVLNQLHDQLFVTREGRILHEVTVHGAETGKVNARQVFNGVPIPDEITGPKLVAVQENLLEKAARVGFDKMITPLSNAMSRHPLFIYNAMQRLELAQKTLRPILRDDEAHRAAWIVSQKLGLGGTDELHETLKGLPYHIKDVEELVLAGKAPRALLNLTDEEWKAVRTFERNEDHIRKAVGDSAMEGALGDTIPYIDDHKVRSQFADEARNLIPFWWAQEAFFRRWAKTLVHSPEAIVKGQLVMQGARHVGAVYKDEEGEDVFMVPGTQALWNVVNRGANLIWGDNAPILPVPMAITGRVRLASPGFDAIGVPGYGPLVGIPLAFARDIFPEVKAVEDGLLGPRGSGRSIIEQVLPSWTVNVYKAIQGNHDTDAQLMSATIQAMQYLEANGHGLPENATAREQQDYIDSTARWAKNLLIFRAVFGFADPAPPELQIGDVEIKKEYIDLFKNAPIEEAISELVKRHPNAEPYTIFGTKSVSGATLPATTRAAEFLEANKSFVRKYPLASSWMLPQSNDTDENLRSVYAQQQELGLRESKTPEEWYADFKFGQGADAYFKARDQYELQRAAQAKAKDRAVVDENWRAWKDKYFAQHPVFADEIQSRSGQTRRENTRDELRKALVNPDLPEFEHHEELQTMLGAWDSFQGSMRQLTGKRGATASKDRQIIRDNFYNWAKRYTTDNPSVLAFYQRVIDPDVGLDVVDRQRLDSGVVGGRGRGAVVRPASTGGESSGNGWVDQDGILHQPGEIDGQTPWTNRIPPSMARGGGDGKRPVPQVPVKPGIDDGIEGYGSKIAANATGNGYTPDMAKYRNELQRKYPKFDVTGVYDEKKKAWYFTTPHGRVRADTERA